MAREFVIRSGGEVFNIPEFLPDGVDIKRVDVESSMNALLIVPPGDKTIDNKDMLALGNLESCTIRQDSFGNYWIV